MTRAIIRFSLRAVVLVCTVGALAVSSTSSALASAKVATNRAPQVRMSHGPYRDLEYISLSVGPNHYFTPHRYINVLECSDPGGKKANLPTSISDCDGNTIQPLTIHVADNGSFVERHYQLFSLPNLTELAESSDNRPVCDAHHYCVLYIGEDQERFTWPKIFSAPFLIKKAATKK